MPRVKEGVVAFDFDGVIGDSVYECYVQSMKAVKDLGFDIRSSQKIERAFPGSVASEIFVMEGAPFRAGGLAGQMDARLSCNTHCKAVLYCSGLETDGSHGLSQKEDPFDFRSGKRIRFGHARNDPP